MADSTPSDLPVASAATPDMAMYAVLDPDGTPQDVRVSGQQLVDLVAGYIPYNLAYIRSVVVAMLTGGEHSGVSLVYDSVTATINITATETWLLIVGDETTSITTGVKLAFRMPFNAELLDVRATLTTASTSGNVVVDVNEAGVSVIGTKLTVEATEKSSLTAATQRVITDSTLLEDAEVTVEVDSAGTGAKGLKVWLTLNRLADVPAAAPAFVTGPTLSGTPAPGSTLTVAHTETGDPPVIAEYRWWMEFA